VKGQVAVRPLEPGDIATCERILRGLPDWFGFEQTNAQYIRDLETMRSFVAVADGEVLGFLSLHDHNPQTSEIHVLAVREDLHRRGIGRALVERAEDGLRGKTRLLQVKTLGPSREDVGYERTRAFYEAMGFIPLEETTAFWGEKNPTLILVKPLMFG
jgi:GNAT superfamily N-acetyltransferase